jgi:hypothetical protein
MHQAGALVDERYADFGSGRDRSITALASNYCVIDTQTATHLRLCHQIRSDEPKHSFSARTLSLTDQESIKQLTKALTECSIARFNSKELHEWLFSSLRWTPAEVDSGTGLDFKTLHLPPGGKQFMQWIAPWERMKLLNRFGIYRILAAADSALFRQAPGVIAFVGGRAPEDILECGQLMQRTWLALNAQGIAVHPYYVLTDLSNRLRQKKLDERWSNKITTAQAIADGVVAIKQGRTGAYAFPNWYTAQNPCSLQAPSRCHLHRKDLGKR